MTIDEFAVKFNISKRVAYAMASAGLIKAVKVGNKWDIQPGSETAEVISASGNLPGGQGATPPPGYFELLAQLVNKNHSDEKPVVVIEKPVSGVDNNVTMEIIKAIGGIAGPLITAFMSKMNDRPNDIDAIKKLKEVMDFSDSLKPGEERNKKLEIIEGIGALLSGYLGAGGLNVGIRENEQDFEDEHIEESERVLPKTTRGRRSNPFFTKRDGGDGEGLTVEDELSERPGLRVKGDYSPAVCNIGDEGGGL